MMWRYPTWVILTLILILSLAGAGCGIDSHLQNVVKIDDPFAIDDERDFTGMVISYLALPGGESTLVRMPGGKHLLVDTGRAEDSEQLIRLLAERHVTKLEYVILTNDQPEQAGGFAHLARKLQIETVMLPKLIETSIRQAVPLRNEMKLVPLSEGDRLSLDKNIAMTALHPSEYLFLSPQDNALVFQLKHDELRFLFTSSIGEKAEERLIRRHPDMLKAEVLKVADQGSNQASSQPFLTLVDPQVAIIQTGRSAEQLKPGQEEIIERLGESWAETYITSQNGTITILSNGKDYRVLKGAKR